MAEGLDAVKTALRARRNGVKIPSAYIEGLASILVDSLEVTSADDVLGLPSEVMRHGWCPDRAFARRRQSAVRPTSAARQRE